jgi:hypothetical protein
MVEEYNLIKNEAKDNFSSMELQCPREGIGLEWCGVVWAWASSKQRIGTAKRGDGVASQSAATPSLMVFDEKMR